MYNCIGGSRGGQGRAPPLRFNFLFYFNIDFRKHWEKQESISVGCVPPEFVVLGGYGPRGVWSCEVWSGGYDLREDMVPGGMVGRHYPPPRGQTDVYKNITFPQLLLCVVIRSWRHHLWSWRLHLRNPYSYSKCYSNQYNILCKISNNIEVYGKPVPRTKKIPYCVIKFEASEEGE